MRWAFALWVLFVAAPVNAQTPIQGRLVLTVEGELSDQAREQIASELEVEIVSIDQAGADDRFVVSIRINDDALYVWARIDDQIYRADVARGSEGWPARAIVDTLRAFHPPRRYASLMPWIEGAPVAVTTNVLRPWQRVQAESAERLATPRPRRR